MTARPVQAVFFWRADMTSAFKAVYGRLRDKTYTKDFHQPIGEQARALERAFGLSPGGDIAVTWRWPGGESKGRLIPAHDYNDGNGRLNLRWPTDQPPPPWRLHPDPGSSTLETLQGQPASKDIAVADAQLVAVQAAGENPWFIAVHLRDEGPVLHARLVLENPAPGREYASWETLPKSIRTAMTALPTNRAGGAVDFKEGTPVRADKIVKRIVDAFQDNPNVLLVGPPGTGKTVAMEDFRALFESGAEALTFDPEALHGAFQESTLAMTGEPRVRSLVFHPAYSYENFVVGLLPEPAEGGGVTVKPHVGPLLELAHFASEPDRRALLICDEFNRGSAAAIFGDTLALLDRDKRAEPGRPETGATVATPYYHLEPQISPDEKLAKQISLPRTLYLLAAMNSADRSVAPLDAALRRRFSILFIEPDIELLAEHLGAAEDFNPADSSTWTEPIHIKALAVGVLRALNERIEAVAGRDFLLGQSVFWHLDGDTRNEVLSALAAAFDNQLMGTLTLSFTDNDAALAAVLNVDPGGDLGITTTTTTAAAIWHQPDEAIRQVAGARLRPVRFQDLDSEEQVAAFASLL